MSVSIFPHGSAVVSRKGRVLVTGVFANALFSSPKTFELQGKDDFIMTSISEFGLAMVTKNGNLYFRSNTSLAKNAKAEIQQFVNHKFKVRMVACGLVHAMVLLSDNTVQTFGDGLYGSLGHGHVYDRKKPSTVYALKGEKISFVACYIHSIAITEDGKVYTWGPGTFGRLGTGNLLVSLVPERVRGFDSTTEQAVFARAGHTSSFVITKSKKIFAWGHNNCGQLGLGESRRVVIRPQSCPLKDVDWKSVASSQRHSMALSVSGQVYVSGCPEFGKLGVKSRTPLFIFSKVDFPEPIYSIDTAQYTSIALSRSGLLYSWGATKVPLMAPHRRSTRLYLLSAKPTGIYHEHKLKIETPSVVKKETFENDVLGICALLPEKFVLAFLMGYFMSMRRKDTPKIDFTLSSLPKEIFALIVDLCVCDKNDFKYANESILRLL